MILTRSQRDDLYILIWQEPQQTQNGWVGKVVARSADALTKLGLVEASQGKIVGTAKGRVILSAMARTACRRPKNYMDLSEQEQWAIDRNLGILDWDGN